MLASVLVGVLLSVAPAGDAAPVGDGAGEQSPEVEPPAPKLDHLPAQPEQEHEPGLGGSEDVQPAGGEQPAGEQPAGEQPAGEQPAIEPGATTPPGEGQGPEIPESDEEDPNYAELDAAIARTEDLPYFPTAARKSAVRRNNDVLVRPFRKPVYTVAAAARLGVLIGRQQVVQPIGWGVAMHLRLHFLPVVKSRFGVEIQGGHSRFQERRDYESFTGNQLTRITLLTHTDFGAGPSVQIPLGAVYLQAGASAGVSVSTLLRPISADSTEDELISETDFLLRGGMSLGVPILNRHGLSLGVGVQHVFSNREVAVDPTVTDGDKATPFSTWLDSFLAYQVWF